MTEYAKNRDKAEFLTSKFMNLEFEETFGIMPDNVWDAFNKESRIPSPIQIGLFTSIFRPNVSCMPILVNELLQN